MLLTFVRHHFDNCDFIQDQPIKERFCNLISEVQYNLGIAVPGVIKGISQVKLSNELGLESLKFGKWFRSLSKTFKVKAHQIHDCTNQF